MSRRKENKKVKLVLPLFIAGLMVLSVFGVVIGGIAPDDSVEKYNDIIFKRENTGRYSFTVQGATLSSLHLPTEVEGFGGNVRPYLLALQGSEKIYIDASDQQTHIAVNEVYANLRAYMPFVLSCDPAFDSEEHCADLPLKSCEDIDENAFLLGFALAEESSIDVQDQCMIVSGSPGYIQGVADYILFAFSGVFQ